MKEDQAGCVCPYCCKPVSNDKLFCKPCKVELGRCPHCNGIMGKHGKVCPVCGKPVDKIKDK